MAAQSVVGAIVALGWHRIMTAGDVHDLLLVIVGGGLGALAHQSGVTSGAKAANTIPTSITPPPPSRGARREVM